MDKETIQTLIKLHAQTLKILRAELKAIELEEENKKAAQSPFFTPVEPAKLEDKTWRLPHKPFSLGD